MSKPSGMRLLALLTLAAVLSWVPGCQRAGTAVGQTPSTSGAETRSARGAPEIGRARAHLADPGYTEGTEKRVESAHARRKSSQRMRELLTRIHGGKRHEGFAGTPGAPVDAGSDDGAPPANPATAPASGGAVQPSPSEVNNGINGAPPDASSGDVEPKPRKGKEIVIAWEASLMYLMKDGKPAGKPLVLNGAKHLYLRERHLGSFRISEKRRVKRSNLYDVRGDPLPDKDLAEMHGAVMRNWMRIGSLPVGLHYSPAFRFYRSAGRRHRSHGCYRMSRRDSEMVFRWSPVGTQVHVVRNLAGTEWEFLRASTPPELLPGDSPQKVAKRTTVASAAARASAKPTDRIRRPSARLPVVAAPGAVAPEAPAAQPLESSAPAAAAPPPESALPVVEAGTAPPAQSGDPAGAGE